MTRPEYTFKLTSIDVRDDTYLRNVLPYVIKKQIDNLITMTLSAGGMELLQLSDVFKNCIVMGIYNKFSRDVVLTENDIADVEKNGVLSNSISGKINDILDDVLKDSQCLKQ